MRYYSYNEMKDNGDNEVITVSEEWIRKTYYPYWLSKMKSKFGEEKVEESYNFYNALDDWIVVNWAWESTNEVEKED